MRANLAIYERGLKPRTEPALPVASIGNITLGGTGKTTTTRRLARDLAAAGVRPGIILRGHRRSGGAPEMLISGGAELLVEQTQAGDEAAMLAFTTTSPIAVGKRRERVIELLEGARAQVALLDDGFQYFRMRREIDLVLVDGTFDLSQARVFPAGYLREPLDHLRRATHLMITHCDLAAESHLARTMDLLSHYAPDAPVIRSRHAPSGFYHLEEPEEILPPEQLRDRDVLAMCAVGNPASFEGLLLQLGARVAARSIFADHHAYCPEDWELVREAIGSRQVELIAVTEKDAVKLPPPPPDLPPVVAVAVDLQITQNEESWDGLIFKLQEAAR